MRIEVVVEAEALDSVDSLDVIRLGNEVARLVSMDLHGTPVQLIHAAVASNDQIAVPRDYDAEAPILDQGVAEDPYHPYTHKSPPVEEEPEDEWLAEPVFNVKDDSDDEAEVEE